MLENILHKLYSSFLVGQSGITVGFSGSGGACKTPSPTQTFAGARRIPSAAKPLSAATPPGWRGQPSNQMKQIFVAA